MATIFLATTTYMIVMNLNNLVRLGKGLYQQFRNDMVRFMMDDGEWSSMGKKFSRFRPERENTTPSEWHIVVFAAIRLQKRSVSSLCKLQEKILKLIPKGKSVNREAQAMLENCRCGAMEDKRRQRRRCSVV